MIIFREFGEYQLFSYYDIYSEGNNPHIVASFTRHMLNFLDVQVGTIF